MTKIQKLSIYDTKILTNLDMVNDNSKEMVIQWSTLTPMAQIQVPPPPLDAQNCIAFPHPINNHTRTKDGVTTKTATR